MEARCVTGLPRSKGFLGRRKASPRRAVIARPASRPSSSSSGSNSGRSSRSSGGIGRSDAISAVWHHLSGTGEARSVSARAATEQGMKSEAERFVEQLQEQQQVAEEGVLEDLREGAASLQSQIVEIQAEMDSLYNKAFGGLSVEVASADCGDNREESFTDMDEAKFRELGRSNPKLLKSLLEAKERLDSQGWQQFQAEVNKLSLMRTRFVRELEDLEQQLTNLERSSAAAAWRDKYSGGPAAPQVPTMEGKASIVLITGFESFNIDLYKRAGQKISERFPEVQLRVYSDRDLEPRKAEIAAALESCDIFFGSLLFDFDQVEWLRDRIGKVPVRLVFESALELMSCTQVGSFEMAPSGKSKGPPPAVKKVLSMFSSGREEDKMVGYLSFLKIGPKLLRFIPGDKARDLKNWLTAYGYWNQGGVDNVVEMFLYLVGQYITPTGLKPAPVKETPPTGCLHPDYDGFFSSPREYMRWYEKEGALRGTSAPVVAVLLYRKHVITNQYYIPRLISQMEAEGVIPVPVFINGVEAHTIVRDQLTSADELQAIRAGQTARVANPTLAKDAVQVDAVVSTIGFPLVGGPAGSMEGGRQADIAKSILTSKNIPYIVAAPLLIQDMESWSRDGIAGLQSVVLYSLPELDGAIDTVPLGGLAAGNIHLSLERVSRMVRRVKKWVDLRRTATSERKLALLLYGFPPGVGATGTAALLNVPKSLERLLETLREEGYDLGEVGQEGPIDGEAIITALKAQEDQRAVMEGAEGINRRGCGEAAEAAGFRPAAAEMSAKRLRELLSFPEEYGPSEWGPLPFLPDPDIMVNNMEKQWGRLESYRGICTSGKGNFVIPGIQCGNVWIGVQPLLGLEGDPMRLLFERDLTPHPQYAAFYKWLQEEYQASAVLHFGMHGTVEWLPGAPLGNTGFSWSDALLGNLPNVYIYACNNPSESIIAKRRGYGTIVSHNVPPYGRAGLYKQMATLRELLSEYREDPQGNEGLRATIVDNLELSGLQEDCPFRIAEDGTKETLTADTAAQLPMEEFLEFAGRLNSYLLEVENRLFSEGLHVLGQPPSESQMAQYLGAYFDGALPEEAVEAVAKVGSGGLEAVKASLEGIYKASTDTAHEPLDQAKLSEALEIRKLLTLNTEEMRSTVRALNGEFVLPEAGGDLLRDGAGVLPTGRNIHALDPYRMPSPAAMQRGTAAAEAILDGHRKANGGALPETVAVNLWGLDAIKTKGESVAITLHMVGARPVKEGTGRIARFELIPLEVMGGRPRVDVLCNMSGIFRDSFQNVVELLDDLFQRAAEADEPPEQNFIRKHSLEMQKKGLKNTAARLFSNPAGDYGSMVNERIGASNWDSGAELGDTWASRNSFSYGRGGERGTARPEVLQSLLSTTERVIQEIDSVEYGLTDIQEYYANTGALKAAAQAAQGGRSVGCSIVESFGKDPKPKELEDVLRLEYRSKLLNPKWAEAMADQGSGGAYEISQRMTAMLGWGATVSFQEDWTWNQAAETYVLDEDMAEKLRSSNPQAFTNVVKRMLEAAGRGMWNADDATLDRLRSLYSEMDDELEGVSRSSP
mmetsp:Transcript_27930/g.78984  ORF Transcript_27930/g.78984 Transcript_27930/m.78984 type:complete len:1563 (-) Transcript_27930:449-5137(-)